MRSDQRVVNVVPLTRHNEYEVTAHRSLGNTNTPVMDCSFTEKSQVQ